MNYLLDTHIFLWWIVDHPKLSRKARQVIENGKNTIFVSSASIWEISIKESIGKIKTSFFIEEEIEKNCFTPLPLSIKHAENIGKLKFHHKDPFDRMLLSQAKTEGLTLITHDSKLKKYKAKLLLV